MLSLLAIFIVDLVLLFALFKASDLIFTPQAKLRYKKSSIYLTIAAFVLLFLLSAITTFGSARLIANLITSQKIQSSALLADIDLNDCSKLLDTISLAQNKITLLDDHRNIEETSPLFTIKLEYQKGSEKLREYASIYEGLDVTEKSKIYSQNIAQKMQEKADYFDQRIKIKENKEGAKQISQLLKKMDRVTQEQQTIIEDIERQCAI